MYGELLVIRRIALYVGTIRYLRLRQIVGRIRFRLCRPGKCSDAVLPLAGLALRAEGVRAGTSWLGDGRFNFLHVERRLATAADWNNPDWDKLWLYNLHYFDYLRQSDMPQQVGDELIGRWIAENPYGHGNGWEPYTISLRVVNWIKWHLQGHSLTPDACTSLLHQTRFLCQRLETHLLANHYLANAKALVFAGLFFDGEEARGWLRRGCAIYHEQLTEQILADGGHFERSAMYHSIILEDLLDLVNIGAPLDLADYIRRMLRWLAVMTGPDGNIALFNDAAFGIAPTLANLQQYALRLQVPVPEAVVGSVDLPESGYACLQHGPWTLMCDGAPVGPAYQPGHAHADTLSFELWYGKTRVVIDSGTSMYHDGAIRQEQRGTAGHNTLRVDGKNSSAVWSAHRVARRTNIVERSFEQRQFCAAHDGYGRVVHKRLWELQEDLLLVKDSVLGAGRHQLEIFWHLHPDSKITIHGHAVTVTIGVHQFYIEFAGDGQVEEQLGHFGPEFGVVIPHPVICWHAVAELPVEITTVIRIQS